MTARGVQRVVVTERTGTDDAAVAAALALWQQALCERLLAKQVESERPPR